MSLFLVKVLEMKAVIRAYLVEAESSSRAAVDVQNGIFRSCSPAEETVLHSEIIQNKQVAEKE